MNLKIAVAGEIRSGKDTVCDYILGSSWGMEKLYFAEGIRDTIYLLFPDAFDKGKPRKLYQDIGQFMRTIDPKVWIKYTERRKKYMEERYGTESFICTDLRQPNEYEWLKENGFAVIKVEADEEIRIERMKASGDVFDISSLHHPVEQQIKDLPCDYLITNNDTLEALYEQVDFIIKELKGGVH